MIDFSCQDKTPELCAEARSIIASANIVLVGVGALGTTAASVLVRSGAENITLIDDDIIAADNLPRQTLFDEADVGKKKVVVAKEKLLATNGKASIKIIEERLSENNNFLENASIVLDCTDNIASRLIIDQQCESIPWVHAAAVGKVGEVMGVLPNQKRYADIIKGKKSNDDCASSGIMTIASVLTATVQATVALKILLGRSKEISNKLYRIDAWNTKVETFTL